MQAHATRFWAKVTARTWGECWPWLGAVDRNGYGRFAAGGRSPVGRTYFAHRVAFFLAYGRWPVECRHACDHPPCCNPLHLQDGTRRDNVRDMWARGRRGDHAAAMRKGWVSRRGRGRLI